MGSGGAIGTGGTIVKTSVPVTTLRKSTSQVH